MNRPNLRHRGGSGSVARLSLQGHRRLNPRLLGTRGMPDGRIVIGPSPKPMTSRPPRYGRFRRASQ